MEHDNQNRSNSTDPATNMMFIMALMMGLCFGSVLLSSLVPIVGWPVAIALGLVGIAAMVWLHQRLMGGHGKH
jgi:hypothetical protein